MANRNNTRTVIAKDAWMTVESLPAALKPLDKARRTAMEAHKKAREAFEDAFTKLAKTEGKLSAGHAYKFSYNFGRLSIAEVAEEAAAAPTSKRAFRW